MSLEKVKGPGYTLKLTEGSATPVLIELHVDGRKDHYWVLKPGQSINVARVFEGDEP